VSRAFCVLYRRDPELPPRASPPSFPPELFLLLGETSVDMWVQKLDWIATHGGMALLNVHPDYLRFSSERSSRRTYAAELYEDFLKYVRLRYGESLWNPLPRELAAYIRRMQASPARSRSYLSDESTFKSSSIFSCR
jgi:hypothetical protein